MSDSRTMRSNDVKTWRKNVAGQRNSPEKALGQKWPWWAEERESSRHGHSILKKSAQPDERPKKQAEISP